MYRPLAVGLIAKNVERHRFERESLPMTTNQPVKPGDDVLVRLIASIVEAQAARAIAFAKEALAQGVAPGFDHQDHP